GFCEVHAHDSDWRAPAYARTGADVVLEIPGVIGVAAVGEYRGSPALEEIALELDAPDGEEFAADDLSVGVRRPQRFVVEASDRAVAPCEEPQFRRELVEVGHGHRPKRRPQQHTLAPASRVDPLRVQGSLEEAAVRDELLW